VAEQRFGVVQRFEHRLGHAVVQHRQRGGQIAPGVDVKGRAALDARHRREAALARDFGRLRRPGRDGAEARRHQLQRAGRRLAGRMRAKQVLQARDRPRPAARSARRNTSARRRGLELGQDGLDVLGKAGKAGGGEGGGAAQLEDFGHGWRKLRKA
jgi:hypothetical protein